MLIRVASGIALTTIVALSFIVPLLSLVGPGVITPVWHVLALLAVLTSLPSVFCFIRNESNGAVDNVSGVVAVLLAAQAATAPNGLGVLITSGEELGLAGAREWVGANKPAGSAPSGIRVLNCDTVDDTGNWRCMHTGARPKRIAAAVETIAAAMGVRLPMGRLIPGILADSVAFADVGIESVTLSRGTLSTLARIHTRRDTSNTLTGVGVAEASALLTALAKELG
jgi:Zn-dependent M28 family amino/carboxypeptidase